LLFSWHWGGFRLGRVQRPLEKFAPQRAKNREDSSQTWPCGKNPPSTLFATPTSAQFKTASLRLAR
jgi:hypothetical protein